MDLEANHIVRLFNLVIKSVCVDLNIICNIEESVPHCSE